ncbi:MAG: hypothetical protein ACC650_08235 [Gammaproteobacteria bacterium]
MKKTISKTKSLKNQIGQGMTEYIIIVALIAIAAIGVFGLFGNAIKGQVGTMAAELGGGNGTAASAKARASGDAGATEGIAVSNLDNYGDNNQGKIK